MNILEIPTFEKNPEAIWNSVRTLIARGKEIVAKIGTQSDSSLTFSSTLGALDDLSFDETVVINRIHLLQNVSPDEAIRKTAQEAYNEYQNWAIERAYDPHVYAKVMTYSKTPEAAKLIGEQKKYLEETLRDYRRLGFELAADKKESLKELQKKLSQLETDFSQFINDYEDEVWVTKEDLDGLDEDFIRGLRSENGKYRVTLQYPDYLPIMEFCKNEALRKTLVLKKLNTATKTNKTLINEMISLRDQIARTLGYKAWNHYVLEERMAKTPERVNAFLTNFEAKLKPKAQIELNELRRLKREETGDPQAEIQLWDYGYFASKSKKLKFQIDAQKLKEHFPLQTVLAGMLKLVEKLFSLKFTELPKGTYETWHEDARLIRVDDAKSGEGLGYFYMDLFPRSGKYGHAAAFGLTPGKLLTNGKYQRPVCAMVCNFPSQSPSLLAHGEVETLFHEFGHILHGILTRAQFNRFSGTSVAWDFVEAPSQIMENWCWDPKILEMITPSDKKIPHEMVDRMNEAKKAGMGLFYLRQLSFAKTDLALHDAGDQKDADSLMKRIVSETFLPHPEETSPAAGFGHMVGYASGYYGYSWADVMAADMFSLFKNVGLLDEKTGLRLRQEIFEPGSSRDENVSLEKFLGRPLSQEAFFKDLGLEAA